MGGTFKGTDYLAGSTINKNCTDNLSDNQYVTSRSVKDSVTKSISTSESTTTGISNSLAIELTEKAGLLGSGIETKISNTFTYSFEQAFETQFGYETSAETSSGTEFRRFWKGDPLSKASAYFAPILQKYRVELTGADILGLPAGYPVEANGKVWYLGDQSSSPPRWGLGGMNPLTFQYGNKESYRHFTINLPAKGSQSVMTMKSIFMSAAEVPGTAGCNVAEWSGNAGQNPKNGVVTMRANLKPWKYFAISYNPGSAGCSGYTRVSVQAVGKSPIVAQTYVYPMTGSKLGVYQYTRAGTESTAAGITSPGPAGAYIRVDCRDSTGVYRPAQNFKMKVWPQPWLD
ncbi:hypothetical protein [Streptomyces sp. NPDC059828]|uniref:hypothetical protein n=1 Tax=Streptomyces sp. NPDC059828 TaxID=3346965 RepID=UPI0036473F0C